MSAGEEGAGCNNRKRESRGVERVGIKSHRSVNGYRVMIGSMDYRRDGDDGQPVLL